jgi:hypothetical protein
MPRPNAACWRLVAEPELLPIAVEEFLRAYAPVTMARLVRQWPVRDVAGGQVLRAGTGWAGSWLWLVGAYCRVPPCRPMIAVLVAVVGRVRGHFSPADRAPGAGAVLEGAHR